MSNLFFRLICLFGLVIPLGLPANAHAEWIDVTDRLDVHMERPKPDKKNLVWRSDFYVTNIFWESLRGPLRVVVTDSSLPVSSDYGAPDGTTDAEEPYYDIVTDPDYLLLPGVDSPTIGIYFEYDRKRVTYEVRVELDAPPPEPLSVLPLSLDFGAVLVGGSKDLCFSVGNQGDADLTVSAIQVAGFGFQVFPPLSFTIPAGGAGQAISARFSPDTEGPFTGTVTVLSDGGSAGVALSGSGEIGFEPGDIAVVTALALGAVAEGETVEKGLAIGNEGAGLLAVTTATTSDPAFAVEPTPGDSLPFVLNPGEVRTLQVALTPPAGSGGDSLTTDLSIGSDDPDEDPLLVALSGDVIPAGVSALETLPVVSTRVRDPDDLITAESCASVGGQVLFTPAAAEGDSFAVTLTDSAGNETASPASAVPGGGGATDFGPIDACALRDGVVTPRVAYYRNGEPLGKYAGSTAVKHTGTLPAPLLDPVDPVTVFGVIEVCGSARQQTGVYIQGGASTVSARLGVGETAFCLDVPLRRNTENTLIATAVDDVAPAPRPTASAAPIRVVHLDPSEVVIAEADARPLTIEEIQTLVENGVLDLDDPENYRASLFTVVLSLGAEPDSPTLTVSEPVAVRISDGTVKTTTFVGSTNVTKVIVVPTPDGGTLPGVIVIDRRIATLKELFQVTIALLNNSDHFVLDEVAARIQLPAGLTAISSGIGSDIEEVPPPSEVEDLETVVIGEIVAGETGMGQFIVRGDSVGTHPVTIGYAGFITEGGLPAPVPFDGSVSTSVQVYGPPELGVVVRHPSQLDDFDVQAGEIYDLIVGVTNLSARPALYASLELFLGGDARVVDADDQPVDASSQLLSLGAIQPGQTLSAAFRVQSLSDGEIIACQAIATEAITLSVDTGPEGAECAVANTYPASFVPLPADMPPTVIGVSPPNSQANLPVTASVVAMLTPQSGCIVPDCFKNVVYQEQLDEFGVPFLVVADWDLDAVGTFYLEELDAYGNPVRHIPVHLVLEDPLAGATTIAELRLGLAEPYETSRYLLKANTRYRATLVGGTGGVCSAASGTPMENSFRWNFITEQLCDDTGPPIATMVVPEDGAVDRPLNQQIVLEFTNRMDPASFALVAGDLAASSFGVYENAIEWGGVLTDEGQIVPGEAVFSDLNRRLTYTPSVLLGEQATIHLRLTSSLMDVCGNALETPSKGELLFSFETQEADTTAPDAPLVNPVPSLTKEAGIQVSGSAEASSIVTVSGAAADAATTAGESGLFSVFVPLTADQTSSLQVQAADASGNQSPPVALDRDGNALCVTQDGTPPALLALVPADGASGVPQDVVIEVTFDEVIDPVSVNANNFELTGSSLIAGSFAITGEGTGFTFTPDQPLEDDKTFSLRMRAGGIKDLAGNGFAAEINTSFSTGSALEPVIDSVVPAQGTQDQTFTVTFTGENLATANAVVSANPGISGGIDSAQDTQVNASITIAPLAETGETTLGLTTEGGTASVGFTVLALPAPTLSVVEPSGAQPGQTLPVTLTGTYLDSVSAVTSTNPGVTAVINGAGQDGTTLFLTVTVAADAPLGITSLIAQGPGGSASIGFAVDNPPVVSGVSPAEAYLGQTLNVSFSGTALSSAQAIVSSNPGISGTLLDASDTTVEARISIASVAPAGPTDVGVRTTIGEASTDFAVNIMPVPLDDIRDIVSRAVSVYQADDPVAALRDAVSRVVSVYQADDPFAGLRDAVSRAVSVYQPDDPVTELRDAVSRAVSVLQE